MATALFQSTENQINNDKHEICDICTKKVNDPINYGDMISKYGLNVHYYCLLLSTNLPQNCADIRGILGFLTADIKKEIKAAKSRVCRYCDEIGASIKCDNDKCNKYFHLTCGSVNYCQNEFINEFKSYCHEHITVKVTNEHKETDLCRICHNYMNNFQPINSIMPNCCKYGWVHSFCLKKYALHAGYYLKCLWCRNPNFRDQIRYQGIFVPDRDATWELDKSNFAGLYENYLKCDAEKCFSPYGRKNKKSQTYKKDWQLLVCNTCGSCGVHKFCGSITSGQFTCANCLEVFTKTILTNNVPTNRTLVSSFLEVNQLVNNELNENNLNMTLFMPKLTQNLNNIHTSISYSCTGDDTENRTLQKLLRWHPTKNEVESVVLAYVNNPKEVLSLKDITITDEKRCDDSDDDDIDVDLLMQCYREVMEEDKEEMEHIQNMEKYKQKEDKQKKLMKGGENTILVEDSDDECEKSITDLLAQIINPTAEVKVPKPIIEN